MATSSRRRCLNEPNVFCYICGEYPLQQGSQTRGPHVAREGLLCGPRCFLGIFKKLTFTLPGAWKKMPRNN